jgi:hypothetical protein
MDVYTIENITYKGGKVIHSFKDTKTNVHGSTNCEYKLIIEYDKETGISNFRTDITPLQPMYTLDTYKPRYIATPKIGYKRHIELPDPTAFELVGLDKLNDSINYDMIGYIKKFCDRKGLVPWYGDMTATKNGAITTFELVTPEQHRRLTALERERRLKALEHEDD